MSQCDQSFYHFVELFYDAVFVSLGIKKVKTTEKYIAYAQKNNLNEIEFYVTKPYNLSLIHI